MNFTWISVPKTLLVSAATFQATVAFRNSNDECTSGISASCSVEARTGACKPQASPSEVRPTTAMGRQLPKPRSDRQRAEPVRSVVWPNKEGKITQEERIKFAIFESL